VAIPQPVDAFDRDLIRAQQLDAARPMLLSVIGIRDRLGAVHVDQARC
jgi:hypothetical protein